MAQAKKYKNAIAKYDREATNDIGAAVEIVKSLPQKNFDESVDLVARLGIDPRKADQMVRGTVALPSGSGKNVRVAVFATGDAAQAAKDAGAEFVGAEELAEEMKGGMLDFDVTIAAPDMMPIVGQLGKVLGPRGLMPNPKTGTVTPDVAKAVEEFKGGKVEYRADRFANIHVPIGKLSFSSDDLVKNFEAVVEELVRAKPASSKGRFIKKLSISSTMGPSVKLDSSRFDT